MVTAAQSAAIDAQRQVLDLHDRLHDAHQQLLDSQRAERSTAQMVWVLYWALGRAFQLVGDLTRKRDVAARLTHRRSGLEPAERNLNAAQATRARTQHQLERAQSEHRRAIALAEAAAQKVAALRTMLTRSGSAGPHDVHLPEVAGEDRMGIDDLADLNGGLDRIEHLLDAQDGELTRLDHEINGPSTTQARGPSSKDVARLRDIAINPDISLNHRRKACLSLTHLGPEHHSDAATAFRSILMDKSARVHIRAPLLKDLGALGGLYRQEASTIFKNFFDDESSSHSDKITILAWYRRIGDDELRVANGHLKRIALDDSVAPLYRVHAAEEWFRSLPDAATQVIPLLEEIIGHEGISEVARRAADDLVHEIATNPWPIEPVDLGSSAQ